MRKELDEELCRKYPEIFRDRNGDMRETAMVWGFPGDGWYDIIDAACANIKNHVDHHNRSVGYNIKYNAERDAALKGDWTLFNETYDRYYPASIFEKEGWTEEQKKTHREDQMQALLREVPLWRQQTELMEYPVATQVKEKYGTLRFYLNHEDDYISGVIAMAEALSAKTCETCGAPGKLRGDGWVRTLCDEHAKEQGYDLENDL